MRSDSRPWHGGRVLVCEDNLLMAEVVGQFLRECGFVPMGPVGRLESAMQMARKRALAGHLHGAFQLTNRPHRLETALAHELGHDVGHQQVVVANEYPAPVPRATVAFHQITPSRAPRVAEAHYVRLTLPLAVHAQHLARNGLISTLVLAD